MKHRLPRKKKKQLKKRQLISMAKTFITIQLARLQAISIIQRPNEFIGSKALDLTSLALNTMNQVKSHWQN